MPWVATVIILIAGLITAINLVPSTTFDVVYERQPASEEHNKIKHRDVAAVAEVVPEPEVPATVDDRPVVQHVPLPEQVKMIYMTACVAGTSSFRSDLVELIKATEVNALMIDIKDYSGTIAFPPTSAAWKPAWIAAECGASDMREFIAELHELGVFVIGRITVFQDPFYAPKNPTEAVLRADQQTVWTDYKGLSFVDVSSQAYWDHMIELAVESYNLGFDELNFDYVRYPSDGNMQDIYFPRSAVSQHGSDKQANLETFFAYLHTQMTDPTQFAAYNHQNTGRPENIPWTSADLFGMTTTNYDDLSIGQIQDRAAPYFDFIAPMVYPSHYPNSFLGLGNPNEYPYEVVYHAMKTGVDRMLSTTTPLAGFLHEPIYTENASGTPVLTDLYTKPGYGPEKFRTWIQDFDYGGVYDAADVRAQIQASYDAGVDSWMIWSPSNRYTLGALLPAEAENSSE